MILRQKIKQLSVSAVKKKIESDSEYLSRFLTARENCYCRSIKHFAEPAAARIAAKQACLALFCVPARQFTKWILQIQIERKNTGKPFFKLSAAFKKKIGIKKNQTLLLSLAHERELAVAWVALVEKK